MTRSTSFDVGIPTVSTVVPRRGRTPKTVRHVSTLAFSVPILDDGEAPVVATFDVHQDSRKDLSPAYPIWMGWDLDGMRFGGLPAQDHLRASPRDLPAVPFCSLASLPDAVRRTFADPKIYAPFANAAAPCTAPLEIECTEAVSTNAQSCLGLVSDRMDEMFAVGGVVYLEIPGPVVATYRSRVFNDLGSKATMIQWEGVELLAPGIEREGVEAFATVQPGIAYAIAVARGMHAIAGPWRLDLLSLTGDLVRAAGIAQQRLDLYDPAEVRKAVDGLHSACHGTKIVTILKGCLDKGYFDADVRLDVRRATPEREMDAAAYGVGF